MSATRPAAATLVPTLVALLSLAACSPGPPDAPADAVRRLFGAVEAGDCDVAFATLSRAHRAELERQHGCAEVIAELRRRPLDAVIDTRLDGRDDRAHLVRVRLRGRATDSWIRVEAEDGQWKISSL